MLGGGGIVIQTDAPVQRIRLDIEFLDAPIEESLRAYFFDGGWTASEEMSVPMSGDIYLRDDTRDDGTTHLGHSTGIIRVRVCVGRMGGDRQAFGYDNWLPQEHFIRLWPEPQIREPLRLTRTPTTPIPDGEIL